LIAAARYFFPNSSGSFAKFAAIPPRAALIGVALFL